MLGPCGNCTDDEVIHWFAATGELLPCVALKTTAMANNRKIATNASLFSKNLCIEFKLLFSDAFSGPMGPSCATYWYSTGRKLGLAGGAASLEPHKCSLA